MLITLYHLQFVVTETEKTCKLTQHRVERSRFMYEPSPLEVGYAVGFTPLNYTVHRHYEGKLTRWPSGLCWDVFYEKPNQIDRLREEGWKAIQAELELDNDRLAEQLILTNKALTLFKGKK